MTFAATSPSSTKSLLSSYNEKDTVEVWKHNREQGRCSFCPRGSSSPVSKTDQKQEKKGNQRGKNQRGPHSGKEGRARDGQARLDAVPGEVPLKGRHMGLKTAMDNKRGGGMLGDSRGLQQIRWLELHQPSRCEATVTTEVKGEITVFLSEDCGDRHTITRPAPLEKKEGRAEGKQALILLANANGVYAFHRVGLRSPV